MFSQRRNPVDKRLERILPRVQKPARYVGGEYNAVVKDKAEVDKYGREALEKNISDAISLLK